MTGPGSVTRPEGRADTASAATPVNGGTGPGPRVGRPAASPRPTPQPRSRGFPRQRCRPVVHGGYTRRDPPHFTLERPPELAHNDQIALPRLPSSPGVLP